MRLLLSPYEIDASSLAAAAAVLLGDDEGGVLTVQPSPFEGATADAARVLAMRAPSFGRLLETWRWTGPLWRGGLLRAAGTGRALAEMVLQSRAEMIADPMLASARGVLLTDAIDDEAAFIEALSRDLIRGGSDPAISLPLVAVAERLAADSEASLVCGDAAGLIWKARVGSGVAFSFAMPVPAGASGREILAWRESLASPLAALRVSLREAVMRARIGPPNGHATAVRLAADAYAGAFRTCVAAGEPTRDKRLGGRPTEVIVSISICPTGQAVREAVARLARIAPCERLIVDRQPGAALVSRLRPIAILRVRPASWDFEASG